LINKECTQHVLFKGVFKVKNNLMFQAGFFLGRVKSYRPKNCIGMLGEAHFKIGVGNSNRT
jgi:hypothetical protein